MSTSKEVSCLFTLTVNNTRYKVLGVVVKTKRVVKTVLNKGKATQIQFYLFDGSVCHLYTVLFSKVLSKDECQYLLAGVVNKQFTATFNYKDTLQRIDKPSIITNFFIFSYGLNQLYITGVSVEDTSVILSLFDIPLVRININTPLSRLFENERLLSLTRSTSLPIDRVALQVLTGNLKLDGGLHVLSDSHIKSYGIDYEVVFL